MPVCISFPLLMTMLVILYLGPSLIQYDIILTNCLHKDPISKHGHIPRFCLNRIFRGHSSTQHGLHQPEGKGTFKKLPVVLSACQAVFSKFFFFLLQFEQRCYLGQQKPQVLLWKQSALQDILVYKLLEAGTLSGNSLRTAIASTHSLSSQKRLL